MPYLSGLIKVSKFGDNIVCAAILVNILNLSVESVQHKFQENDRDVSYAIQIKKL